MNQLERRLEARLRSLLAPPADVDLRAAAAVARARRQLGLAPRRRAGDRFRMALAAVLVGAVSTFAWLHQSRGPSAARLFEQVLADAAPRLAACTSGFDLSRLTQGCSEPLHGLLPADARGEGPFAVPDWPGARAVVVFWHGAARVLLCVQAVDDHGLRAGRQGDVEVFRAGHGDAVVFEIAAAGSGGPFVLPLLQ